MKLGIRNSYIILISALLSIIGTLASRGNIIISVFPVPYLYTVGMILLIIGFYKNPFVIPVNKLFTLLLGVCMISAILNSDNKVVISCMCMFVIFSYFLKATNEMRICFLLGTGIGQFVFLFRYGLTDSWNGNSVCIALAFVTLISLLSYLTKISDSLLLLITFAAGVIVIIMSSRTSIIAFFISMICLFFIRYKKTSFWPVKLTGLFLLLLSGVFLFQEELVSIFFNKWENRGYEGVDVLTGRGDIWIHELKYDWTFFGNGEFYFYNMYGHNDAHNIFIQVLGRYGVIVLIVLVIFMVRLIVLSCRVRNDSKMYIFPIVIAYTITGFFENVLFLDCKMYVPSIIILIIASALFCDETSNLETGVLTRSYLS